MKLDTGTPRLEAKEGFYYSWIKFREQLGQAIIEFGREPANPTIQLMVLFGITSIPSEEERNEILNKIDESIKLNLKDVTDTTEKAKITNRVYIEVGLGSCQDWYDNFVAIVKKNVWGIVNINRTAEYGYAENEQISFVEGDE